MSPPVATFTHIIFLKGTGYLYGKGDGSPGGYVGDLCQI